MADETYRRYDSGRYGETNTTTPKVEPPKEKGKFLNEVEKKTQPGADAGKIRDKTRKTLEESGVY